MNSNLYLVDLGFNEDTVIYELVPKKVAQLPGYTIQGIDQALRSFGATSLIVDAGSAQGVDEFKARGFNVLTGRIVAPPKEAKRG